MPPRLGRCAAGSTARNTNWTKLDELGRAAVNSMGKASMYSARHRMRPTYIVCTLAIFLLLIASSLVSLLCPARPRIIPEQIRLIKTGMTLQEVERVLGCKPGYYARLNDLPPIETFGIDEDLRQSPAYWEWFADTRKPRCEDEYGPNRQEAVTVRVWFNERGEVIDRCSNRLIYTPPSITDRIRKWFRLRWQ